MAVCPVLEKPRRRARLECGHPLCAECAGAAAARGGGRVLRRAGGALSAVSGAVAADAVDGYYRRVALSYNCAVHPLWLERRGAGVEVLGLSERALVRTRGDLERLRQLFAGPSVLMELGGAAVRRLVLPEAVAMVVALGPWARRDVAAVREATQKAMDATARGKSTEAAVLALQPRPLRRVVRDHGCEVLGLVA